jgi:hypothetical protein
MLYDNDMEAAPHRSGGPSLGPERLRRYFEVWDSARRAYEAVLESGVLDDDVALSRDANYRQLLADGMKLRAMGGEGAIIAATVALANTCPAGRPEHFAHLWGGLGSDRKH